MSAPAASAASAAKPAAVAPVSSEDVIAKKFDNCDWPGPGAADFVVNTGIGFAVGVVGSVLLFRRRGWPVALSTGFGAGVAYSNCNYSLNPYVLPGTKILPNNRQ